MLLLIYELNRVEVPAPPLPQNMTVLGGGAFRKITVVKWGHGRRGLI